MMQDERERASVATDGTGRENGTFSAIGFQVCDEEYGLPLASVQEVIITPRITRVPNAADHIKGVINLHGNVVPVIDIARRFRIGETKLEAGSRIVVVDANGEVVGLLAESVSKVARFKTAEIQPPPPLVAGIAADYLDGVVRLPDRFLIFLNLATALADDQSQGQGDDIRDDA